MDHVSLERSVSTTSLVTGGTILVPKDHFDFSVIGGPGLGSFLQSDPYIPGLYVDLLNTLSFELFTLHPVRVTYTCLTDVPNSVSFSLYLCPFVSYVKRPTVCTYTSE